MKTLTLNLAKKLLIKDYKNLPELNTLWQFYKSFNMPKSIIEGKLCKPLFKGNFLTEENASELVFRSKIGNYKDYSYKEGTIPDHLLDVLLQMKFKTATESFISAIESKGFYWLENPIKKPDLFNYHIDEKGSLLYNKRLKSWKEGQEKTLKYPIIFEILE